MSRDFYHFVFTYSKFRETTEERKCFCLYLKSKCIFNMNNINNYDRFVNKVIYIACPLILPLGRECIDGLVPGLRYL